MTHSPSGSSDCTVHTVHENTFNAQYERQGLNMLTASVHHITYTQSASHFMFSILQSSRVYNVFLLIIYFYITSYYLACFFFVVIVTMTTSNEHSVFSARDIS